MLSADTQEGEDEIDGRGHYTKLYPRAQVHLVESDGSDGDEDVTGEGGGGVTPRQSSLTGSLEVVSSECMCVCVELQSECFDNVIGQKKKYVSNCTT